MVFSINYILIASQVMRNILHHAELSLHRSGPISFLNEFRKK